MLGIAFAVSLPSLAAEPLYKATLRAVPADGQIIVHDLAWHCASGSCVALRTGASTDSTVCSALARNLGALSSFAVGDAVFDSAAIEKCNRRVR